jgi:hypothetical protein
MSLVRQLAISVRALCEWIRMGGRHKIQLTCSMCEKQKLTKMTET